jgi:DNA-binding GntR family transcriptional regulator
MFETAADSAYEIIKQKIINGELKPGEKLSKRRMAGITGVSVIPVIEALNRLEHDGIVESKAQWGSYVTVPSADRINDIYALRMAVECQITRILSVSITKEQEAKLRDIAGRLDAMHYSEDNERKIQELHYLFHSTMAEFTGYSTLMDSLKKVDLFNHLCKAVASRRRSSDVPGDWHMRLVDAISSKIPDEAEKLMRSHINDSYEAVIKEMKGEYQRF